MTFCASHIHVLRTWHADGKDTTGKKKKFLGVGCKNPRRWSDGGFRIVGTVIIASAKPPETLRLILRWRWRFYPKKDYCDTGNSLRRLSWRGFGNKSLYQFRSLIVNCQLTIDNYQLSSELYFYQPLLPLGNPCDSHLSVKLRFLKLRLLCCCPLWVLHSNNYSPHVFPR